MSRRFGPPPSAGVGAPALTPAGLQRAAVLTRRRLVMLFANLATLAAVAAAMAHICAAGGWSLVDVGLILCALALTPWHAIGFWNALAGFILLHVRRDGIIAAAPFLDPPPPLANAATRVAVLMTVRNEDPRRALKRFSALKHELDGTDLADVFDYHLLSDTSDPTIAEAEEQAMDAWRAVDRHTPEGGGRIFYRRRSVNTGFKAGNLREFCIRTGTRYDFMLPLDADSVMGARTILHMLAIMQAYPRLGILQSLAVGLPAKSPFARLFQFGMRHGMRCYTVGASWWAGDCGPFWGHNALVRVAPFRDHCALPDLPGPPPLGGPILSHDQVEAVLMRRAGYEVRVLPLEGESYEENPPALTEFIRRDLRWCLGNMQYLKLLHLPGIAAMSRFQLLWAILMFATVPAYPMMLALLPLAALEASGQADFPTATAAALYLAMLVMSLSPKIAGIADTCATPGGVARYGGPLRFARSVAAEAVFSLLLGAVTATMVTLRLPAIALGRTRLTWQAQMRDGHQVPLALAARAFWAPTLFGLAVTAGLLATAPDLLAWASPVLAGFVLAIPFAMITASPRLGAYAARTGLCAIPEEFTPPPVLVSLERHDTLRPAAQAVMMSEA